MGAGGGGEEDDFAIELDEDSEKAGCDGIEIGNCICLQGGKSEGS